MTLKSNINPINLSTINSDFANGDSSVIGNIAAKDIKVSQGKELTIKGTDVQGNIDGAGDHQGIVFLKANVRGNIGANHPLKKIYVTEDVSVYGTIAAEDIIVSHGKVLTILVDDVATKLTLTALDHGGAKLTLRARDMDTIYHGKIGIICDNMESDPIEGLGLNNSHFASSDVVSVAGDMDDSTSLATESDAIEM